MKLEEEMPRPAFVELKPNRDLLNANFEGYKLSNDNFPAYKKELGISVEKIEVRDEISAQRLHIFTTHNYLHSDPWFKKSFYVVDSMWKICRISYEINTDIYEQGNQFRFKDIKECFKIPCVHVKNDGRFNTTFKFLDERNAVVTDGCGTLYLMETKDRSLDSESWTIIKQFQFTEVNNSFDPFVLQDAVKYESDGDIFIDALIVRVRDKDSLSKHDEHLAKVMESPYTPLLEKCSKRSFTTTISWITLKAESVSGTWELKNTRSLVGTGPIRYGSIELDGNGIIIASDNQFEFYYNDGQPLRYTHSGSTKKAAEEEPQVNYLWKQTAEEITVWLRIPIDAKKTDLNCEILPNKICCALNSQILLEGELLHHIKPDQSFWTIEDSGVAASDSKSVEYNRLQIVLHKAESGQVWGNDSSIFSGKLYGKEVSDLDMREIESLLGSLCSDKKDEAAEEVYDGQQLEECDSFPVDSSSLIRIGKDAQCTTHFASLSSHQWLFSSNYGAQKLPSFTIRHDVDAIVWQPPSKLNSPERSSAASWELDHLATFLAMGYVQASKKDRRFTVFPEDHSFVALVDASKHVYLYRQSVGVQTDLRNRRTGKKVSHVAKQMVLSIEPPLNVLGAAAVEDFLFILTSQNIHAFRVQQASESE